MGFSRQEYRSGLPFPSPGDHFRLGIKPTCSTLAGRFFTTEPLLLLLLLSLQSCLTLRDPTDGSPPGSAVPEILQARILEWVAIAFSAQKLGTPAIDGLASWEVYSMVGSLYGQLFTGSSYMAYIKS